MTSAASKPRVPAKSWPILLAIDDYVRRYNLRGKRLADAASDVCDGGYTRAELEPLVRRRLLSIDRYCESRGYFPDDELCGRSFTVRLTERAMRRIWPARCTGAPQLAAQVS